MRELIASHQLPRTQQPPDAGPRQGLDAGRSLVSTSLRSCQVLSYLVGRPPRTIPRSIRLDPPAFLERAGVHRVEPELVQQAGHRRFGLAIVAGEHQRAAIRRRRRLRVRRQGGGVDVVEGVRDRQPRDLAADVTRTGMRNGRCAALSVRPSGPLDRVVAAKHVIRIVLALDLRQALVVPAPVGGLPVLVVIARFRDVAAGAGREAAERFHRRPHA